MDLERTHNSLMTALRGIAAGMDHTGSVPTHGASVKIFGALNNATMYLPEPFHSDDLDVVDSAFDRLGLKRTSDRKDKVAEVLLAHFVPAAA
jgi:hypothetical protein